MLKNFIMENKFQLGTVVLYKANKLKMTVYGYKALGFKTLFLEIPKDSKYVLIVCQYQLPDGNFTTADFRPEELEIANS